MTQIYKASSHSPIKIVIKDSRSARIATGLLKTPRTQFKKQAKMTQH